MFDLDQQIATRIRHLQNRGRLAQHHETLTTNEIGTHHVDETIEFDCLFTEQPIFSYGSEVDMEAMEDLFESEDFPLPVAAGFVVDWTIDEKGLWIGATVAFRVYGASEDLLDGTEYPVTHHLTWTGNAIKGLGDDELPAPTPPLHET